MTNTQKDRLNHVANAMELKQFDSNREAYIIKDECNEDLKNVLMTLIYDENIGGNQDISYEICASACDIISDKTSEGNDRDSLTGDDLDLYADADSRANVYTAVQLSYLNINNEDEISQLMQDEAITSVAQACTAWHTSKVVEACERLKDYVLND